MHSCAFYPVTASTIPIVRFINQGSEVYRITTLLSFPGSGLDGRDGGYADNGTSLGLTVKTNIMEGIEDWDYLIVAEHRSELIANNDDGIAFCTILDALEAGKSVICTKRFSEDDVRLFDKVASMKRLSFQYLPAERLDPQFSACD